MSVRAKNKQRQFLPRRYYTGLTSNVAARLGAHNAGRCAHTDPDRPWIVDVVVEFLDERRAVAFERYLKSGSGSAFALQMIEAQVRAMLEEVPVHLCTLPGYDGVR